MTRNRYLNMARVRRCKRIISIWWLHHPRSYTKRERFLCYTLYLILTSHMPRIYITQKEFDNIPHEKKTETHIIQDYQCKTSWDLTKKSYPYTVVWNKKTLTCSVCWTQTKWRQWYNRDKWFGICSTCYDEEQVSALNSGSMQDDLADLRSSYGVYWVHYGKLSDFILQE